MLDRKAERRTASAEGRKQSCKSRAKKGFAQGFHKVFLVVEKGWKNGCKVRKLGLKGLRFGGKEWKFR